MSPQAITERVLPNDRLAVILDERVRTFREDRGLEPAFAEHLFSAAGSQRSLRRALASVCQPPLTNDELLQTEALVRIILAALIDAAAAGGNDGA